MPVLHISINPNNHGAVVGFSTDDYITEHGVSDTMKKNFLNVRSDATDVECKAMCRLLPVEVGMTLATDLTGTRTTIKVGPGQITEYVPDSGTLTIQQKPAEDAEELSPSIEVNYTSHNGDDEFTIESTDFADTIKRGQYMGVLTGIVNSYSHTVDTDPLVAVEDRARMADRELESPEVATVLARQDVPQTTR